MALAGQDKTVTLTDGVTGDTIKTFHLKVGLAWGWGVGA